MWLYGSVARGDADERSDVDILVVGSLPTWREVVAADDDVSALIRAGREVSLMHFSWHEVLAMQRYGSLFLHHVRLHGRPLLRLTSDPLVPLLEELPPYQRALREIEAFKKVLEDVATATLADHAPAFELSVIATALRHAFILGCYIAGEPDFGRTTPFSRLSAKLGLTPKTVGELSRLYEFRLYQQRRAAVPYNATIEDVQHWLRAAGNLLAAIERRVIEFDRTMSEASGSRSRSGV